MYQLILRCSSNSLLFYSGWTSWRWNKGNKPVSSGHAYKKAINWLILLRVLIWKQLVIRTFYITFLIILNNLLFYRFVNKYAIWSLLLLCNYNRFKWWSMKNLTCRFITYQDVHRVELFDGLGRRDSLNILNKFFTDWAC